MSHKRIDISTSPPSLLLQPILLDSADPSPIWQKQLHRRQPFPDNYVHESFLAVIEEASTSPPPPLLLPLIISSLVISLPLSSTFLFIAVFVDLLRGALAPSLVIYGSLLGGFVGYLLFSLLTGPVKDRKPLRPTIITLLLLHCLSPILRTLTEATTSDSIWPLAGVLLLLGLVLGDYGSKPETAKGLAHSLSLTSTLSASVVLASRLPTNTHVFALVLFAVVLFALAPSLLKHLRAYTPPLAFLLFAITFASLHRSSSVAAVIFASTTFGVCVLAPFAMVWNWTEKSVIKGNWDVAAPVVRSGVR
ncbi:phosphatidylinositol N-acetylglucosaminyltransferase subunit C [Mrakia frigida]|uniref:phosphatidylinositol N-acetylglucosaminyltransferase n=1 Tax=Mrakia frigida TaxID=29902 RepID=UPI003FCC068B